MKPGRPIFSVAEVLELRRQWDAQTCDVAMWAEAKNCNRETIRRIGRRETYRDVGVEIVTAPRPDDPSEEEIAASLARLQSAANNVGLTPGEVDDLHKEIDKEGKT